MKQADSNPAQRELLLCIPGPWRDRSDFVRTIISETKGDFMFAGLILANPKGKDHVPLDFAPHDPQMRRAFDIAGQGKLSPQVLDQISGHSGVAYLHFPVGIISQRERVLMFTNFVRSCGGFAVKVESAGVGHERGHWVAALTSENPFDLYRMFVTLIGDSNHYYSCGMHHFGFPDVEVERSVEMKEAADLMNRFNYWQIVENPELQSGHSFSISADAPRYRMTLKGDTRHEPKDLFHNANGIWSFPRCPRRHGLSLIVTMGEMEKTNHNSSSIHLNDYKLLPVATAQPILEVPSHNLHPRWGIYECRLPNRHVQSVFAMKTWAWCQAIRWVLTTT